MQGSDIGGSSQGRKSADLIKVATRGRWRDSEGRRSAVASVPERERESGVVHSRPRSPSSSNELSF